MDKKPEECKAGAPEWMVTYGDLVTLLMCFFVLLFAFSEIDAQKFEAVMQSFQGSAGVLEAGKSLSEDALVFDAAPENDTTPITQEEEQLEVLQEILAKIKDDLESEFDGSEYEDIIEFDISENKLIIRLKDNVLFDSAKAAIKNDALEILAIIGEILQGEAFEGTEIAIEGHTDDVPINTARFPSNWELSGARAVSVLKYFIEELKFPQHRLSIAGYGEQKPINSNDTVEGRANNRRVEIIVEKFIVSDIVEPEAGDNGVILENESDVDNENTTEETLPGDDEDGSTE